MGTIVGNNPKPNTVTMFLLDNTKVRESAILSQIGFYSMS